MDNIWPSFQKVFRILAIKECRWVKLVISKHLSKFGENVAQINVFPLWKIESNANLYNVVEQYRIKLLQTIHWNYYVAKF